MVVAAIVHTSVFAHCFAAYLVAVVLVVVIGGGGAGAAAAGAA